MVIALLPTIPKTCSEELATEPFFGDLAKKLSDKF